MTYSTIMSDEYTMKIGTNPSSGEFHVHLVSPVSWLRCVTVSPFVSVNKDAESSEGSVEGRTETPRFCGSRNRPTSGLCSFFSDMRPPVSRSYVRKVDPPGPDREDTADIKFGP